MGQLDIEKALITKLESLNLGIELFYENYKVTPPNKQPYAIVNVSHDQPFVATIGDGGEDNHDGFLQILLKYPLGKGAGDAKEMADTICSQFKAGVYCTHLDQSVIIRNSGIGPAFDSDSRYTLPITVNWYARTRR